jgi:hypothetical protein
LITNRIITRGLSSNSRNRLVSKGFYSTLQQVVYAIRKLTGTAKKKIDDIFDEWYVKASLVEINNREIEQTITGIAKKFFKKRISTFVKSSASGNTSKTESINITASIKKQK